MKLNVFRKGFNYAQDGPGNRLVYHLQGCNMRCGWCSNPEGIAMSGSLMVVQEHLIESVCPHGAIAGNTIDRERCASCVTRECISQYQNQGIRLSSSLCDIESIVSEAKRSASLFYDGGGVTLSGGEATLQFKAVGALLQKLKAEGIHTAIETNGTHPRLHELFPWIDYLIMDFKHYNNSRLKEACGIGTSRIKQNLTRAISARNQLLIRIPLISTFNDSKSDAELFASCFRQFDTSHADFEFLTYHEYGKDKWAQCGMPTCVENAFVAPETLAFFHVVFKANGLNVIHT